MRAGVVTERASTLSARAGHGRCRHYRCGGAPSPSFSARDLVYSYSFDNPKGRLLRRICCRCGRQSRPRTRRAGSASCWRDPTTGLTALQGVDDALHLRKGEAFIIHGASGGVGTLAVQFATLRGAQVLANRLRQRRSSRWRCALAPMRPSRGGARKNEDIAAEVRRFAPSGIDAVLALARGTAPRALPKHGPPRWARRLPQWCRASSHGHARASKSSATTRFPASGSSKGWAGP